VPAQQRRRADIHRLLHRSVVTGSWGKGTKSGGGRRRCHPQGHPAVPRSAREPCRTMDTGEADFKMRARAGAGRTRTLQLWLWLGLGFGVGRGTTWRFCGGLAVFG
jgi:hypothetical protein